MNKTKKKWLIISGSTVLAGFLIFSAAWFVFYYRVAKPHLPPDFQIGDEDAPPPSHYYTTYYCPENAYGNYDNYYFDLPKFGTFRCVVGFTSTRNYLEDQDIIVNMSGSKFAYSMGGNIGWNGKIKRYIISAKYYTDQKVKMPEGAFFMVAPDGNLLNADTASAHDLELFQEAKPEILEYIRKIEEIYDC